MAQQKLAPVHPGEILQEEFLTPFGLSHEQCAQALHISLHLVKQIVSGQQAITAEIALRLARYFSTSAELWLNLQSLYELEKTRDEIELTISQEITPFPPIKNLALAY